MEYCVKDYQIILHLVNLLDVMALKDEGKLMIRCQHMKVHLWIHKQQERRGKVLVDAHSRGDTGSLEGRGSLRQ